MRQGYTGPGEGRGVCLPRSAVMDSDQHNKNNMRRYIVQIQCLKTPSTLHKSSYNIRDAKNPRIPPYFGKLEAVCLRRQISNMAASGP